eukprot:6194042-Pleurochrysis_carterae.AAC.7
MRQGLTNADRCFAASICKHLKEACGSSCSDEIFRLAHALCIEHAWTSAVAKLKVPGPSFSALEGERGTPTCSSSTLSQAAAPAGAISCCLVAMWCRRRVPAGLEAMGRQHGTPGQLAHAAALSAVRILAHAFMRRAG